MRHGWLSPLGALWGQIARGRHALYDRGWMRSTSFDRALVAVGNLTVGGTGKTPHVEYLIRALQPHYRVAVVSRGYGRRTKGFRLTTAADNAATVGDEPLQIYQKFNGEVPVAVAEERAVAIPNLLADYPEVQVILLDDALQHRAIRPDVRLLLTDFNRPFYQDYPLPAGRLREFPTEARRADACLMTKCPPALSRSQQTALESELRAFVAPDAPVHFTTLSYGTPVPLLANGLPLGRRVVLCSGLAQPAPLRAYAQEQWDVVAEETFRDHHRYTPRDLRRLADLARSLRASLLSTEKDAVKWQDEALKSLLIEVPVYCLPIEPRFVSNEGDFLAWLRRRIDQKLGN
ncbi:tetraacyldisaccharide 4'-kinase [Catalinimonas alkaloidigena]|uniref:Tetraacyldisaccharide 4'-kinase n=1 Tax=Catalinimonas alkaloidigena TaxID=1075417 RepID=A0A1G9KC23_9BACT|nr:tetraacyldisaccharide 4'-kinase [Catalinimonas alkaloidigena]SDL46823.1 tetraacyldisaccharide 4'-kinase [Catalinimonas alkaloidigena]